MLLQGISIRLCKVLLQAASLLAPWHARKVLAQATQELDLALHHFRAARHAEAVLGGAVEKKLNVGCGPNVKDGWVNIDLDPASNLQLDIRRPLPFPDRSCDFIYGEHVFEHLSYPGDAEQFLRECHRVLKSGGILSIGVPDLEWPLQEYATGRMDFFDWSERQSWAPRWAVTRLDKINYIFRQQNENTDADHKYAYDFETLGQRLRDAGFVKVRRREFDPSLDSDERKTGTLYCDAETP
jgi:predicted SAM-dependent methyltransferase